MFFISTYFAKIFDIRFLAPDVIKQNFCGEGLGVLILHKYTHTHKPPSSPLNPAALYTVLASKVEPEPSPCAIFECGANAICRERDGVAVCQCTANYIGNPYLACRPECVINPDCPSNLMCVRNKCVNPCAGVCGRNAECSVVNHQPMCTCLPGYTGDPFSNCFIDRKCRRPCFTEIIRDYQSVCYFCHVSSC